MSDDQLFEILSDIRNWVRIASYPIVKTMLADAVADSQARRAFQMLDGKASSEQIRVACKMSPNKLVALTQKWTSMGLVEVTHDKKKRRLFDLRDFDLAETSEE